MKLLKQIIDEKLKNADILEKNHQFTLSYQEKVSAYLLALCYLSLNSNIHRKSSLWKKYILTLDKKYFLKLLRYKPEEDLIILNAIRKMDKRKEEQAYSGRNLFSEFGWAIYSYEHEDAE